MDVIAYTNYECDGIVTSQPYRKFLEGNILIKNKAIFEKFYEKFIRFYDFININRVVKKLKQETNEKTKTIYNNERSLEILSTNTVDITPKMDIKQTTLAEISRDSQRETGEVAKRHHAEEMLRRQLKGQRILNCKEDKRIHTLNTIIERTELCYPDQKNVSIDYYHFNYEDRIDDGKLLAKFLDIARNNGCFGGFTTTNGFRKTIINFIEVNLDKTKEYRDALLRQQNGPKIKDKKMENNVIPIKDIRLDANNCLLEINKGEENIFFKTKQKNPGLTKETKLFKILYHL